VCTDHIFPNATAPGEVCARVNVVAFAERLMRLGVFTIRIAPVAADTGTHNKALKPIVISLAHFVHSLHAEGLASAFGLYSRTVTSSHIHII